MERVPGDPTDGRAISIRRTELGWEINRVARQLIVEIQQESIRAVGEERFGQLLHLLRRLALALDEPIGPAGHPQAEKPPERETEKDQTGADMMIARIATFSPMTAGVWELRKTRRNLL